MIYFNGTLEFDTQQRCAVTLGKFDGVHLGHRKLLTVVRDLKEDGLAAAAFTLNARMDKLILTEEEQRECMERLGMDYLIRCPFVPEISSMTPEVFTEEILIRRLHAGAVVVGSDFRFGYRRSGDAFWLKEHQEEYGFQVYIVDKEMYGGREISSTYIREALTEGDMQLVQNLMGREYAVSGTVIRGHGLGHTMDIPTANILPPDRKILPPDGVYISRLLVRGQCYDAITNIGYKPTVDGSFRGIETNLLDAKVDLYDSEIQVQLLRFVRPEKRFDSVEDLRAQIFRDEQTARSFFGK